MDIIATKFSELLTVRNYYSNIGLWPMQPRDINPEGWLSNFTDENDLEIAAALLDSFIYFNEVQTKKLFESAFHAISSEIEMSRKSESEIGSAWREFKSSVIITYPSGFDADVAASGRKFIREARQTLKIDESRLFDPGDVAREVLHQQGVTDLVFVDDISITGHQFLNCCFRNVEVDGMMTSLEELIREEVLREVYYLPTVCTAMAKRNISHELPNVRVRPAHLLVDRYFANPPYENTALVPDELVAGLDEFLRKYAKRAGYDESKPYGFGNLGLALGFEHSVPDNTLPIFWSENDRWIPLRRRS